MMIACLYPLSLSIDRHYAVMFYLVGFVFVLFTSCLTAILPGYFASSFDGSIRYTGAGISFNLADGVVGGFTPVLSLIMLQYTNNPASFCWFIFVCAIVSLVSYCTIKE